MFAILLIILGIATRLLPHTSQFTAILAVSMFAGLYLKPRQALVLPLVLMVVTDIILGFHDTMVYTWGSMLIISVLGIWLKSRKSFATVLGGSILSAVIFFIITNIGAWISPLYPDTLAGLKECFIMAIPFFRSTLASTVAYSLVLYAGYEWMVKRSQGTSLARLF
jgi:hypothetical protein